MSDRSRAGEPGRIEREGDVVWLVLDDPAKRVNTLSSRLLEWFEEVFDQLAEAPPRAGLIVISGKPDGFVAGADIEELGGLTEAPTVRALVAEGHRLLGRMASLGCPTVAAIHGAAMGAGLELALACDYRVATQAPATRLGLPEVQLGVIPGLGGTQRLPRLIGVEAALSMVLTGKRVTADRARRSGLVDAVCHPAQLRQAAVKLLERPPRRRGVSGRRRLLDLAAKVPVADQLLFGKARSGVEAKTGGHYPAPLAAIEVMQKGIKLPLAKALDVEADTFAELVVSRTAKALMSIFFMKNRVEARAGEQARGSRPLDRVGVLGAGFMGAGVAQVLSHRRIPVVLKDRDTAGLGRGLAQCRKLFDDQVRRRRYRPVEMQEAMARIHPTLGYESLRRCPLVIEAVFEELAVKHQVLRELEQAVGDEVIFASNTSTLPIGRIAVASRRPENVVGLHFFSPVHKMPLVEVIRHPGSSREAVATAVEAARRMGKTPIVVNDGPGFFTSRVLGPYLNEAGWCLTGGCTIDEVDRALTRWGWPVGPLALLDEVGLDIAGHSSEVMVDGLGDRVTPPEVFERLREAGRSGRKSGRGFYQYGGREKKADPKVYKMIGWQAKPLAEQEIAERCWMQMLNETARAIEDGVIEDPVDIDLGVILGFGFPPFRGGLLREADRLGIGYVVEKLDSFAEVYGERFRPAELLRSMATQGVTFHR